MLELDASIGAGEAPGYGAFGSVALGFPRAYFPGESFTLGDALIQTLASQHRELYLGHVQPRAVLWGVVDLQLTGDASGLGGDERLIQGGGSVGVEVVHYQNDSLGGWVVDVDQILYAIRPVDLRPPFGNANVAPTGQGLTDDEEVGRPLSLVLVVVAGYPSRTGGKRLPHLTHKLLALLVQAHLRETLIVGASVDLQNILHAPNELGVLFGWDGPLPAQPGLEGAFLRVRLSNSREMGSSCAHSRPTKRSARRRRLQRSLPSGGLEQASAIRCASWEPSSFLGFVLTGLRWTSAASRPSSTNRSRTRRTVERLISRASAILVSGQAWPGASGEVPSSALSRMRAWVSCRAGASLPRAINPSSLSRSSLVNLTGFFLFFDKQTPPHVRFTAATRTSGHKHDTREGVLGQTNHVRLLVLHYVTKMVLF